MKALVIGGYPEFVGTIVDAYPADTFYDSETGQTIPLYRTSPSIFLKGLKCFFQESHLSFFPATDSMCNKSKL